MSQDGRQVFKLPRHMEKILAALSAYLGQHGDTHLQRVVVNSGYSVDEETDYDGWDGGQSGHTVRLQVPPSLFYPLVDERPEIETRLREAINRLADYPHEHISGVVLELQDGPALANWREKSGLLATDGPEAIVSSDEDLKRLWEPGFFRLFLSHKSEYKKETAVLRDALLNYGASSFVAHLDIEPTREWQDEIERALFSMETLVALLTPGFSESRWTDQEIGVAIGRRVPVISVRLGCDPYGFIGKYQGVAVKGKLVPALAGDLINLILADPQTRQRLYEAMVCRLERSSSFKQSNDVMQYLKNMEEASPEILERLEAAPQRNSQVREAHAVKSDLPTLLRRLKVGKRPAAPA